MPRIHNISNSGGTHRPGLRGNLSVDLLRIPLREIVLQLRRDLENDLRPGESGVLGQEARMRDMHIDVAWRPLVVVDNMD